MKITMRVITAVFLTLILAGSAAAAEIEPQVFVQQNLDRFVQVLKDPQYKESAKRQDQMDLIWEILHATFDFHAVAQRALGRNWRKFTAQQKDGFSTAFAELLGETYLTQIRDAYQNEEFKVVEHDMIKKNRALVKTHIVRPTAVMKVDYSLYLSKKGWRVYDVNVEGVSLVKNYRAQFSKILLNKDADHLIQRVKDQVVKVREKNLKKAEEAKAG